jgi:hypothetical protein
MKLFTIGFTKKEAAIFFKKIEDNKIEILIDIRLNNQSQLAGFTKEKDLIYFLKKICNCEYSHMLTYAPTKEILDDYKKGKIDWTGYEKRFITLIEGRHIEETFIKNYSIYNRVLLLCSEPTPENCHRRLVAEYLRDKIGCEIIHL